MQLQKANFPRLEINQLIIMFNNNKVKIEKNYYWIVRFQCSINLIDHFLLTWLHR